MDLGWQSSGIAEGWRRDLFWNCGGLILGGLGLCGMAIWISVLLESSAGRWGEATRTGRRLVVILYPVI